MKIQLINVGRAKVNKIVEVKDMKAAGREVASHFMSSGVEMVADEKDNFLFHVSAGFHSCGQMRVLPEAV
jgi:hypothetical protein